MTKDQAPRRPHGRAPTMTALATTAVLWASAFPAIKSALDGYGVAGLSFLRLFVASVALASAAPILKVRVPASRDLPLIALCGLAGMSAYQVLLNWGEVCVPAGTASLLVSIAPVFSVVLAAAFLGERLSRRVVLGSVVAIAGSVLIAVAGGKAGYTAAAWVVLAAALVQGVYHFASKPLLRRYSAVEVACYSMWSGTVFLAPLAPAAFEHLPTASVASSVSVLLLGLLPSAVGFVTWGYAVSRSTVAAATAALYLVPAIAIAASFAWLGEVPTVVEIIGGMISIGGVALIRLHGRRGAADVTTTFAARQDGRRRTDEAGCFRGKA
ncbi:EamA family transporter [Actinoallomurus bryophytorum]|uniref:Drug/metabolite transporter (DMT)-like permease n=1 Tax=Actinoallomurus bryophytorum TaxID=1490222 RepID=A0A543CWU4_9ACTN|nr:DMT family transporter [Actinoallomurus bryophytorum]TQM01575.1 drug/metabolite transporter (DMT)-like permease [Actinoallomurus bryophytorum]